MICRARLLAPTALLAVALPCSACALDQGDAMDGGGAAHVGLRVLPNGMPTVSIDDEFGTEVRILLDAEHFGGPDVETMEVVSASLQLDLEHFSDLELALPEDGPGFEGIADGEAIMLDLRGAVDLTHDDWGLCASGADEADDELRVTVSVELRFTPGANDDADEVLIESHAVDLNCVFIG